MSDIVERLNSRRIWVSLARTPFAANRVADLDCAEAAAEITRLRAELAAERERACEIVSRVAKNLDDCSVLYVAEIIENEIRDLPAARLAAGETRKGEG